MVEIDGVRYISAAALIEELGITRQTLWRWRNDQKIPLGYRFRNRQILYSIAEAEEVRQYAQRLEPIDGTSEQQMRLFDNARNVHSGRRG